MYEVQEEEQRAGEQHSRIGIASTVIAALTIVAIIALIVAAGFLAASVSAGDINPQNVNQNSPQTTILGLVGLGFFASVLLSLVGLGLGVAGLIQRRRRKLFAVIGTIFNGIVILGVIVLIALGLALGA